MSRPFRLGLVMDLTLGWRTNYQNWHHHFPQDLNVEPTWVILSDSEALWIDRIPGLPKRVRNRLRASWMLRDGLRRGPFDATFIATSAALTTLPKYMKQHPSFLYIDATPKQLYGFGGYYGWSPSKNPRVEAWKHRHRAASFQQARGVFSMSQWAADSVVADYGALAENMHLMYQGVDLTQWLPGDPALKAAKSTCDLLFVGGDFKRKGGSLLLDWAAQTKKEGWSLHLVTPQAVETSDPRTFVYHNLSSNDPHLQQLYRDADAFVLPTLADCSPWAGIEALASGLPLLLGDTGGTGEIVQSGKTGYLLPQNDPSALAQGLETLIGDPSLRAALGKAARRDAERRFNAPKLIREAVQVMKSRA